MNREEANTEIAALVKTAEIALAKAETLAREHNLSFTFTVGDGGGGTFEGDVHGSNDYSYWMADGTWYSSSAHC